MLFAQDHSTYDNCNDTLYPRFPYNNWFPLQILQNVLQNKWKELLWKEKTLRNNYLNHKTRSQNFLLNYGILYKADPDPYSDLKNWKLNFFMPKFTILIKKIFFDKLEVKFQPKSFFPILKLFVHHETLRINKFKGTDLEHDNKFKFQPKNT